MLVNALETTFIFLMLDFNYWIRKENDLLTEVVSPPSILLHREGLQILRLLHIQEAAGTEGSAAQMWKGRENFDLEKHINMQSKFD